MSWITQWHSTNQQMVINWIHRLDFSQPNKENMFVLWSTDFRVLRLDASLQHKLNTKHARCVFRDFIVIIGSVGSNVLKMKQILFLIEVGLVPSWTIMNHDVQITTTSRREICSSGIWWTVIRWLSVILSLLKYFGEKNHLVTTFITTHKLQNLYQRLFV